MKILRACIAAPLLIAFSGADATIVIDSFDVSDGGVIVLGAAPSNGMLSQPGPTADIIGGERELLVEKFLGGGLITNIAAAQTGGGALEMSNGTDTNSTVTVTWDGVGNLGLGGVNLTLGGNEGLILVPSGIDSGKTLTLAFLINGVSSASLLAQESDNGTEFFFPFANFSLPAAFLSVDSIQLRVSDGVGWDGALSQSVAAAPMPMPLPPSLLLISAGLAGLGVVRRRKT